MTISAGGDCDDDRAGDGATGDTAGNGRDPNDDTRVSATGDGDDAVGVVGVVGDGNGLITD
jgi:cob(I)alamin adenosyltransferase